MYLSWAFALFGLGFLVARFPLRDPLWHGWLAVVMYCFHQAEEHAREVEGDLGGEAIAWQSYKTRHVVGKVGGHSKGFGIMIIMGV